MSKLCVGLPPPPVPILVIPVRFYVDGQCCNVAVRDEIGKAVRCVLFCFCKLEALIQDLTPPLRLCPFCLVPPLLLS
jgi:hypothetical protein